jgi:aminomethyltransferase
MVVKPTGFHDRTSALTDDMIEYEGYWLANSFGDPEAEYQTCREAAIAIDLSPLRKYDIVGPDAEELLQSVVPRDVRRLANGQITYTSICNPDGGMLDDGTLMRLHQDNFRWVGGSEASGEWMAERGEAAGLRVFVRPAILNNLAVQGPRSLEIIEKVVWTLPAQPTITELGWFRLAIGARVHTLDGIPLVVSRTRYSGEKGYVTVAAPGLWHRGQYGQLVTNMM